jgi:hypothetical protein
MASAGALEIGNCLNAIGAVAALVPEPDFAPAPIPEASRALPLHTC